jgi:hypothetical protein
MAIKFANNAVGTLSAAITDTDTSLVLATGQGTMFPALGSGDYFFLTLGSAGNTEIVKVTARSGDSLTVTRAQESTTAKAYSVGTLAQLLITAAGLSELIPVADSNPQYTSLGVGTAASGTTGEIRATNLITAYYSDARLKTKIGDIESPLAKVRQIQTMLYHANATAVALGYDASIVEVGVSAQSVQKVQPEAVAPAPIDPQYLTVRYERLVPLLIEAIKELDATVAKLVD